MKNIVLLLISVFIISCSSKKTPFTLKKGAWLFELQISDKKPELTIPFNVEVISENKLLIKNADEKIEVTEITYKKDSVFIKTPVFGSEFKGVIKGNLVFGNYYNYNKTKLSPIPFTARFGETSRFEISQIPSEQFTGKWQAIFGEGDRSSSAIGVFNQNGTLVNGTFQTETGDYRFLEGVVSGNKIKLSCFDGAHAFLFIATQNNDKLEGTFYSGNTWEQNWTATPTETPQLEDMKLLTFLKPGFKKLEFSFPNVQGEFVSMEDERYRNKVVVVQIFGTWCPNCMDETRYLVELYKKYHSQDLEIIGLDFEIKNEFEYFKPRIERFRKDLNVPYELLLAGAANKKLAAESLPMLNKVISYPTAIFIDKTGQVREIHTGFSGPGTGEGYSQYKKDTEELIKELLDE